MVVRVPKSLSWSQEFVAARGYVLESVEAREASNGDQLPGFWSWEVVKHVCVVGFIRKSLDLHKFERERHGLLGLVI